jgi:hypothetical protein
VSADGGVALVASSARDQVVGQPAATNLLANSLLTASGVGDDDGLDTGTTVIAIPVPVTEVPHEELETGDRLILYSTAGSGEGEAGATARIIGEGRVFSVQDSDDSSTGDIRVSVTVDETLAPEIAAAVRADTIYISQTSAG